MNKTSKEILSYFITVMKETVVYNNCCENEINPVP